MFEPSVIVDRIREASLSACELTPDELQRLGPDRLLVRVQAITYLAENILAYEVVDRSGAELPPFSAGSHVDLFFRDGRIRQYSLCNPSGERHRYVFAVQRELNGRGGSKAIFERVHVGRVLAISKPRNLFPLDLQARHSMLLAGGIGITPIMSMLHELRRLGRSAELHYCARSRERAAFLDELAPWLHDGTARVYYDGGDPARGLDIQALVAESRSGSHLYFCGPPGFMRAATDACAHWPQETVHFEHFSAMPDTGSEPQASGTHGTVAQRDVEAEVSVGFRIRLARTGRVLDVPQDKSIVQVLRENGIEVPTSCESGLCGTCRTRYLEGTPDHRDYILDDDARRSEMLICCSRAKSAELVLDL